GVAVMIAAVYGVRPRLGRAPRSTINRVSRGAIVESRGPAVLMSRRPDLLDRASVEALQRSVGNSALMRVLQRELGKDQDPEGYSTAKGKDNVQGSGTTRREVHDLKYGLSEGFESKYFSKNHPDGDP